MLMRLWECSLAGCVGRGDEQNSFFDRCVRREVTSAVPGKSKRTTRPASLLRWDVPAALFTGGRCTFPSAAEALLHDARRSHDNHTLVRDGFFGHNVTQTGIGWILGELPSHRRGAAFAHDAGEFDPSRIKHPAGRPCATFPDHAATYAAARLNASRLQRDRHRAKASGWNELQAAAAGYQTFISSRWNCLHGDWEGALADQRSFASLVSARNATTSPAAAECSTYGSLYNQVHASWNVSHVRALFYVNDTLTPALFLHRHQHGSARLHVHGQVVRSMQRGALEAASRALSLARFAQRVLASVHHIAVPVVQYVHNEECFWPAKLMARRKAHDKTTPAFRASARGIFKAMPG